MIDAAMATHTGVDVYLGMTIERFEMIVRAAASVLEKRNKKE